MPHRSAVRIVHPLPATRSDHVGLHRFCHFGPVEANLGHTSGMFYSRLTRGAVPTLTTVTALLVAGWPSRASTKVRLLDDRPLTRWEAS